MLMFSDCRRKLYRDFHMRISNMRGATAGTAQPHREAEANPHKATYLSYYSFFSKRE